MQAIENAVDVVAVAVPGGLCPRRVRSGMSQNKCGWQTLLRYDKCSMPRGVESGV